MNTPESEVALSPLPEGIEEYAGKWVAIRNREVFTASDSLEELVADVTVRADDAFYRVPKTRACFY